MTTLILQSLDGYNVLYPTFAKIKNIIQIVIIGNMSKMQSKNCFVDYMKTKWLLLKRCFGLSKLTLITIMVHLMGINVYGKSKTSYMVTVLCGIKNINFLAPKFLVLLHVESHQRFLVLVQQSVIGVV